MRGAPVLAQAFQLVATLAFGGAVALIGQMYHLSGDAADAVAVWWAMAFLAALLFRTPALAAVTAVLLAVLFATLVFDDAYVSFAGEATWYIPIGIALVIALIRYAGADRSRHIAYLTLIAWFGWLYSEIDTLSVAIAYTAIGFVGVCLASLPASPLYRLASTAGAAPAFYSFLLGALGILAMHLHIEVLSVRSTGLVADVTLAAVTLAYALAGIMLAGRTNGAVRYLAYLLFSAESLYLASETIGSMIGTSGFFLVSGLVVALLAFLVIRLERRLGARSKAVAP